jgi:hypothetical protein
MRGAAFESANVILAMVFMCEEVLLDCSTAVLTAFEGASWTVRCRWQLPGVNVRIQDFSVR